MRILPIVLLLLPGPLHALPTMVRLGYNNCLSCHVSPQGAGLLNAYGRGIDEAQSMRGEEYKPGSSPMMGTLSLGGILDQDFRSVLATSLNHTTGGPFVAVNRTRFFYRNVTNLGKGFRLSGVLLGENEPTPRKSKVYDPIVRPGYVYVASAMLQYRPRDGFEIGVGRDALPTGLNIPDQTTFLKTRNRFGYYDTPTQAKAFFWKSRWLIAPFAFAPSGSEPRPMRESGAGLMAEYDLLGKGKTIIGFNGLHGSDRIGNRNMNGVYTRLGFGKWGVLAEHDFTARQLRRGYGGAHFGQHATYAQLFYYFREWLFVSGIAERLSVEQPYRENLWAYKGEVAARLTSNVSVSFRSGVQRDIHSGALSPILSLQVAAKTVN